MKRPVPLGAGRVAAVAALSLLLVPVLFLTEAYVTVRCTALTASFLSRRLTEAYNAVSRTETYGEILDSAVPEITRAMRLQIPLGMGGALSGTVAALFPPSWLFRESTRLTGELLAWFNGRSTKPDLTVSLGWVRDELPRRLARSMAGRLDGMAAVSSGLRRALAALPEGADASSILEAEIRKGVTGIPDTLDLSQAMGKDRWAALVRLRNLNLLYSLFLIFAVPAVLAALLILAGGPATGLAGAGGALLASSGLYLAASLLGRGPAQAAVAEAARSLPRWLSWLAAVLSPGLDEVLAYGWTAFRVGAAVAAGLLLASFLVSRVKE